MFTTVLCTFVREIKFTDFGLSSNDTVAFHTIFRYCLSNNARLPKEILSSCGLAYTQAQLSICEDVIPKFLIGSLGGKLNKNHVFHHLMIIFQVGLKNPSSQVQKISILV